MGHPWTNRGATSNRTIVRGRSLKDVESRIAGHKRQGFEPIMEIKHDYDLDGRLFYVCVMEKKTKSPSA